MPEHHVLDRPVWNALHSGWAALRRGDARAVRVDPAYGPFAAAADDSDASRAALGALAPDQGEIWLVEADTPPPIPGTCIVRTAMLAQMVAPSITPGARRDDVHIVELGDADAPDMRALAELTRPGPFAERTHRFGRFIGVRENGRLIAMAGERMRIPPFAEVSGVCTHPDWRGRGLAALLMRDVAARMVANGETPFLHTYASNATAIALYEKIGFRIRRQMVTVLLARN